MSSWNKSTPRVNTNKNAYVTTILQGGLGNRIFQVLAAQHFAEKTGRKSVIDNDFIVHRLLQLNTKRVDLLCLSDTCGTLTCDDFEYIVDTCYYFGIPYSKFALNLHVNYGKEIEVEKIIHKALDRKIINFDVSLLDSGGCSITISKDKMVPNLSYDLYYKSLVNYIKRKT